MASIITLSSTVPANLSTCKDRRRPECQNRRRLACRAAIDRQMSYSSVSSTASSSSSYLSTSSSDRTLMAANYSGNGSASISLDVEPLLHLVEDIVKDKSTEKTTFSFDSAALQHKTKTLIPGLSQLIHKITCEISYDCPEKGNANERTNSLLGLLSSYSVDAKIVLVLAAFAIRYGDFMVTVNQYSNKSDKLVGSLLLLKEITGTLEADSTLKSQVETIKDIINTVLSVVYYIIELKSYRTWNNILSEIRLNEITYWIIRSVIHCGFSVSDLCSGIALSLSEKSELTVSTQKIRDFYASLSSRISFYRIREEEIRVSADYQEVLSILRFPPASNVDSLYWLVSSSIDSNILYNPATKVSTSLRLLQDRKVLILYSSFATETFTDDLQLLERFYNNTHSRLGYEIVWVPIFDGKITVDEKRYSEVVSKMKWCTLTYEAVRQVNRATVHLLKKDWGFHGRPMLVVLDERGQVIRQDALLMLHVYGERAFPFTVEHELTLLKQVSLGMQFLLGDTPVSQWVKEDEYICLYGGVDIEWSKSLVHLVTSVTKAANIKLETAYVGINSHHKEKVEAALKAVREAKLGSALEHSTSTVFWERVHKYLLHFKTNDPSDASQGFLQWASSLLTYETSGEPWVAIGNSNHIVVFYGAVFTSGLKTISAQLEEWKRQVTSENFLTVLVQWLKESPGKPVKHCHELKLVGNPASIKGQVFCPTCNEPMKVAVLYRCCN